MSLKRKSVAAGVVALNRDQLRANNNALKYVPPWSGQRKSDPGADDGGAGEVELDRHTAAIGGSDGASAANNRIPVIAEVFNDFPRLQIIEDERRRQRQLDGGVALGPSVSPRAGCRDGKNQNHQDVDAHRLDDDRRLAGDQVSPPGSA